MTRATALLRLGLAGAMALVLSGCVSVLPKSKPAQLYHFGAGPPAAATAPAAEHPVGVLWLNGSFQQEAAGDRILTITGPRAAYIAQARWVAPAQVLFDQAVQAAFESAPGRVRLIPRGAPVRGEYVLRLDVRNFETRYEGRRSPPGVLVRVHATMGRGGLGALPAEQLFEARVRASDNRVTAIVAAYDKALGQVLGQVVDWANQTSTQGAPA